MAFVGAEKEKGHGWNRDLEPLLNVTHSQGLLLFMLIEQKEKIKQDAPQGGAGARSDTSAESARAALGILTKYCATPKKGVLREFDSLDRETGELSHIEQFAIAGGSELRVAYDSEAQDVEDWMMKQSARRLLMGTKLRPIRRNIPYSSLPTARIQDDYGELVLIGVKEKFTVDYDFAFQDGLYIPVRQKAEFRVINCMRDRQRKGEEVEVWQAPTGRCKFRKVVACGSVWNCIHCYQKISRQRRNHVRKVYEAFLDGRDNADCLLITLTFRHGLGDDLATIFELMKLARAEMTRLHAFKKLFAGFTVRGKYTPPVHQFLGHISASEMTHGLSAGWHPHLHELFFFDSRVHNIDELRHEVFELWKAACIKVGLRPPLEFRKDNQGNKIPLGVDVRRALSAEEYLTTYETNQRGQWGLESELTRGGVKHGRLDRRSPFRILYDYTFLPDSPERERDAALFIEYSEATLGKHQLEFSRTLIKSLKARGVDVGLLRDLQASDDDLAQTDEAESHLLGEIDEHDFDFINNEKKHGFAGMQGHFLIKCRRSGLPAALEWLRAWSSYPTRLDKSDSLPAFEPWKCPDFKISF